MVERSYKYLPIEGVELDRENPRIKHYLEIYKEVTSEGIALALSQSGTSSTGSSYSSLRESIKVNRGIINPILVNHTSDGRHVVIEGNTRLQIYKEFAEADPDGPWKQIIAIVYEDLPQSDIHAIRLQSHLVGPRDWDPYSKAKYLNQLSNIDKLPIEVIISYCGGKKGEILKLIDAYTDMMKYYSIEAKEAGMEFDVSEFSKFSELQNRSVREALCARGLSKGDFAKWVVKGKIDTAQNVRKLPNILASERARAEFMKPHATISDAWKFVEVESALGDNLKNVSIFELAKALIGKIRGITHSEVKSLKNDERMSDRRELLGDLKVEMDGLMEDISED